MLTKTRTVCVQCGKVISESPILSAMDQIGDQNYIGVCEECQKIIPRKFWFEVVCSLEFLADSVLPRLIMKGIRSDTIVCFYSMKILPDDLADARRLQRKIEFISSTFGRYLTCACGGDKICDFHKDSQ